MKNINTVLFFLFVPFIVFGQENYFKYNGSADVLLKYSPRGSGGRALVHDTGNTLALNYYADFSGGVKIYGDINVTGRVRSKKMFLDPTSVENGWRTTHLEYEGHTLRIGSPSGYSSHNIFEFVPGTNATALRYTILKLCTSNTLDKYATVVELNTNGNSFFNGGNVGIGTTAPKNKLDVKGKIRAEEIIVETGWADFVFDKDYKLPSLADVENHIKEHKRLPDIPSESEVKETGVGLGEMQVKLLQKIEELTLYVIQQEKEIKSIKEENRVLKEELYNLK